MTQSRSTAQLVFRPTVAVAGISVLGVIMLSALHEVSAPRVDARETSSSQSTGIAVQTGQSSGQGQAGTQAAKTQASGEELAEKPSELEVASAETEAASANSASAQGSLDDIVLGDADAPVTVIEYASMTCPHCASFHAETLPKLKEQYIDTGKVKFIMRAFPLDDLAAAAFMLARCADHDKYYAFIDMLFKKQKQWANAENPVAELRQITKVAGFTKQKFDRCLRDQRTLDYITRVREAGSQQYDINSTPTLIVNGQKLVGDQSIEALQQAIDPLLDETEES